MTIDPFSFLHPIEHWISVIDGIKVEGCTDMIVP
jgi:hypothetical protein